MYRLHKDTKPMIDKRKKYYLIIDVESTACDHVADFGAAIVDKKGQVFHTAGVLVKEFYDREELFYDPKAKEKIWTIKGLAERKSVYKQMLADGRRIIASVAAINRWLEKAKTLYNPVLTAYNLEFDTRICHNSMINLDFFEDRFCLWHESARVFGTRKGYTNFALQNKHITPKLNIKTNADVMTKYLKDNNDLADEPHTALEDILDYERVILANFMKQKKGIKSIPYDWRNFQLNQKVAAI